MLQRRGTDVHHAHLSLPVHFYTHPWINHEQMHKLSPLHPVVFESAPWLHIKNLTQPSGSKMTGIYSSRINASVSTGIRAVSKSHECNTPWLRQGFHYASTHKLSADLKKKIKKIKIKKKSHGQFLLTRQVSPITVFPPRSIRRHQEVSFFCILSHTPNWLESQAGASSEFKLSISRWHGKCVSVAPLRNMQTFLIQRKNSIFFAQPENRDMQQAWAWCNDSELAAIFSFSAPLLWCWKNSAPFSTPKLSNGSSAPPAENSASCTHKAKSGLMQHTWRPLMSAQNE